MANKYRVANGDWTLANSWALSDGGTDYTTEPTLDDNVFFTALTPNGIHSKTTIINFKDITTTGFTGTFNQTGSNEMNIYGNVVLGSGQTFFKGNVVFKGTTGIQTVTTNGVKLRAVYKTVGPNSTVQLLDDLNASIVVCTTGTFDANNNDITISALNMTFQGVSNLNNFTASVYSEVTQKAGILFLPTPLIAGGNVTFTGIAENQRIHIVPSDYFTSSTLTSTSYQRQTISCNGTVTATNATFCGIIGAGSANWDLSASTGGCGDGYFNQGITFTTPKTTNWLSGTTLNTASFSNGYPLPQDTVTFTTAGTVSIALSVDLLFVPSLDFTGSTGKTLTSTPTNLSYSNLNLTNISAFNPTTVHFRGTTFNTGTNAFATNTIWIKNGGYHTTTVSGSIVQTTGQFKINQGSSVIFSSNVTLNSFVQAVLTTSVAINSGLTVTLLGSSNLSNCYGPGRILLTTGTSITTNGVIDCLLEIQPANTTNRLLNISSTSKISHILYNSSTTAQLNLAIGSGIYIKKLDVRNARICNILGTNTAVIGELVPGVAGTKPTLKSSTAGTQRNIVIPGNGRINTNYWILTDLNCISPNTFYAGANSTISNCTNVYNTSAPTPYKPEALMMLL